MQTTMNRAKLLDRRATRLTTDNIPVATDVYLRHLEPFALQSLRRATEEGLVPSSLDFGGDDGSIVRLRLTRHHAGYRAQGAE
jgi:hypothetical protein